MTSTPQYSVHNGQAKDSQGGVLLNSLSQHIHIQILKTDHQTPHGILYIENLLKDQRILRLVIISLILATFFP